MMFVVGNPRTAVCLLASCSVWMVGGCNVDGAWGTRLSPAHRVAWSEQADLNRSEGVDITIIEPREVDLVESVLANRQQYFQSLQQLHDFYSAQGYATKRSWAGAELAGMRSVKRFRFLLDAEVPSDALHPVDSIPQADRLYERGLELMRQGGHGVPAVYRKDRMVEAAEVFRQMIEEHPNSDKIADAAFYCGEIHKDYLPGQELIAVNWYERAWTWQSETTHPARFQAAVVYDYRLQDRARALELYQTVVRNPLADKSNVRFAARRIRELTGMDQPLFGSPP